MEHVLYKIKIKDVDNHKKQKQKNKKIKKNKMKINIMPSTLYSYFIMNLCTLFVFCNKVKPIFLVFLKSLEDKYSTKKKLKTRGCY